MQAVDASYIPVAVLALIGLYLTCKVLQFGTRPKNYPPGPPTIPVLGNALQVPLKNWHHQFEKWSKQYGPIMSLKFGAQTMIVMNEARVIRDLLEKRSSLYSARPDIYMREFAGNLNIAFRNNDDVWRRQRKMYHLRLNIKTADRYIPYQSFDSVQLLSDLLERPLDFEKSISRYTVSIASTVLYGWRTSTAEKGYVKDLLDWMDKTSAATTFSLVDFFPFLRPLMNIIPPQLSAFKRNLLEITEIENRLFGKLFRDAKAQIEAGKVYPSFIRDMIFSKDEDALSDTEISNNAAHGFGAATDTQMNTLLGFIKAMILFPEVQTEAHREIDQVVGSSRIPEWSDRDQLPYIRACVEESLRWMPTALTAAVPHSLTKDDTYEGYHIPAGASMLINVWTLNNNTVDRPREFDPSRYDPAFTANESNGITQDSPKRAHFTFGAGRRVCPGFHVAERGLFIAISRMLWAFRFSLAEDSAGNNIKIDRDAVTSGFIVKPEPYLCKIDVRDDERANIIRKSWEESKKQLDDEGNYKEEFFRRVFPN